MSVTLAKKPSTHDELARVGADQDALRAALYRFIPGQSLGQTERDFERNDLRGLSELFEQAARGPLRNR